MNYNEPVDRYIFQKVDDLEKANNTLSKHVKSARFLIVVLGVAGGYLLKKHHEKIETLTKEIKELTMKGE